MSDLILIHFYSYIFEFSRNRSHTSSIQIPIDWPNDLISRYAPGRKVTSLVQTSIANDIIQFNDCYVEKWWIWEVGKYQYIPRFYINFNVLEVFESGEYKSRRNWRDFILHLSDYDRDTAKVTLVENEHILAEWRKSWNRIQQRSISCTEHLS